MKKNDTTYDHIVKYTGLFGGVQGLTMLMNLVRNKIASVLLGPDGLALVNIYNNAVRLISESTNFGISISAVKHVSELFVFGHRTHMDALYRPIRHLRLPCAGSLAQPLDI